MKLSEKMLEKAAKLALHTAKLAAGIPSLGGIHQPKEPENLWKVVANSDKKAKRYSALSYFLKN